MHYLLRSLRYCALFLLTVCGASVQALEIYKYTNTTYTYDFYSAELNVTMAPGVPTTGSHTYVVVVRWFKTNTGTYGQQSFNIFVTNGVITNSLPLLMATGDWRNQSNAFTTVPHTYGPMEVLSVTKGGGGTVPWTAAQSSISGDKTLNVTAKDGTGRTAASIASYASRQYCAQMTLHLGAPPATKRSIDITVNVKNWSEEALELAIGARGESSNAVPIQIGTVQAARKETQTIAGKEKTVWIPGESSMQGTLEEPTDGAWNPCYHYGYIMRGGNLSVVEDKGGLSNPISATKYAPGEHTFTIGTEPPPLPEDIVEKPDEPKPTDPTDTPAKPLPEKPGMESPADPTGTPLAPPPVKPTAPTDPTVPAASRPNPFAGGTGTDGAMTPHDFYAAMRAALKDDGAGAAGPGGDGTGGGGSIGVQPGELGDATGSLSKRGYIDDVQGEIEGAMVKTQHMKSTVAAKLTKLQDNSWMKPTLSRTKVLQLHTFTMMGRTVNLKFDLTDWPVDALRAGMVFAMAIVFTMACITAVREGLV